MLVGYARVSTDEQSLELQISALRNAGCERMHQDKGISGQARSRPGLNTALSQLAPGDTLVVWRLDRLGRSLSHLISTVNRLERQKIGFRSLTENIDTTSSSGRLVFHIMGAMAEFERSLISERTRAGMSAARTLGHSIGRPRSLGALQECAAWHALAEGTPKQEVAERFGVSIRTLERVMHRVGDVTDCPLAAQQHAIDGTYGM
jgi:DNA invertase Pin-like site-specific DNA recombinase